jgi:peptide/nickel transport system permease protein
LTSAAAETPFRRIASDFTDSRIAVFGLALLGLIVLMAIAAPLISPQNPYDLAQLDVCRLGRYRPMAQLSGSGPTTRAATCSRRSSMGCASASPSA